MLFQPHLAAIRDAYGLSHPEYVHALFTDARIAHELGHYDEALAKGGETLALSRRISGSAHPRTLAMLYNLGVTRYRVRDFAGALEAFREARKAIEETLGHAGPGAMDARNAEAFATLQLGDAKGALEQFLAVRELASRSTSSARVELLARAGAAQSRFDLGDREGAIRDLEAVLEQRRKASPTSGVTFLGTLSILGRYEIAMGRDDRAERYLDELVHHVNRAYDNAIAPAEQRLGELSAWIDDDFDVAGFKALAEIRVRQGRSEEAFTLIEATRSRLLRDALATAASLAGEMTPEDRTQLRRLRLRVADIDQRLAKTNLPEARMQDLRAQRAEGAAQLESTTRRLVGSIRAVPPVTLKHDEAYIAFSVNRNRVIAFMRTGSDVVGADLGTLPGLEGSIAAWRRMIESADPRQERVWAMPGEGYRWSLSIPGKDARRVSNPDEIADALGRALVAPLLEKAGGKRRWYVSLDGPLHLLAFDALRVNGRRIVEDREIVSSPSLAVLAMVYSRAGRPAPDRELLGLGAMSAEAFAARSLPPLPHASGELDAIESVFGGGGSMLVRGAQATEARLRALDESGELSRFRYIHLASHGELSLREPHASGVALGATGTEPEADGWVNAGEWSTLRLGSDLVTLSACRTGAGRFVRGEGIVGLPSALLAAGSRSALLSLWAVSDEGTARFMERFYRRLRAGADPAKALRETKLEFARSKGPWSAPRHWAPYVLYGAS